MYFKINTHRERRQTTGFFCFALIEFKGKQMHTQSKYIEHKLNLLTSSRSTFIIHWKCNAITAYLYVSSTYPNEIILFVWNRGFYKVECLQQFSEFENSRVKWLVQKKLSIREVPLKLNKKGCLYKLT